MSTVQHLISDFGLSYFGISTQSLTKTQEQKYCIVALFLAAALLTADQRVLKVN